jgi:hypothetical protein
VVFAIRNQTASAITSASGTPRWRKVPGTSGMIWLELKSRLCGKLKPAGSFQGPFISQ